MGFISGMTLLLSGNTLNFWLAEYGIDKRSIGMFALISLPYAINFIWSPIVDHFKIPILSKFLGNRFSWLVAIQLSLSYFVYMLGSTNPKENLELFAIFGLSVAFLSSTQDVILGAIKSEIIPSEKQGMVSGIYIFGYRIGMLLGSSGAIYVSTFASWEEIYKIFALIIMYFPIILYIAIHKYIHKNIATNKNNPAVYMGANFWKKALKEVGSMGLVITILIFLILYRLPDNFIGAMINPFLIETGFEALQIATVGKFLGIITAIIGGMFASYIMGKIKIIDALFYFGILHALSHLLFILQNQIGDNIYCLFLVIGTESITGGMVMAAYIGFITSLCRGKYRATQYAFFSSMMGISRSILPSISGFIVSDFGWNKFFLFVTIITIPPIWMSRKIRGILARNSA
jgi:PAT family beta-lactamase induction signal transducer AmpG